MTANTPDVIVVDEDSRDYSLEVAFLAKVLIYQPLKNEIEQLGHNCKLLVFIFGSLGNVHRLSCKGFADGRNRKAKS